MAAAAPEVVTNAAVLVAVALLVLVGVMGAVVVAVMATAER